MKQLIVTLLALATVPAWAQSLIEPEYGARYRLTFEADWSAQTHPMSFPAGAHFSGPIGGTHDASTQLWRVGELASPGIESMAETGSRSALKNELLDLIDTGQAGVVIERGGIGTSPGMVSVEFDITQAHPLVSITSMIAPSPDWFVGVDSLDLRAKGTWRNKVTLDLVAFDAGTDSGSSYTASNNNTSPAQPIIVSDYAPLDNGVSLGRFVFELLDVGENFPIQGRHTGLYYDPARSGEGVNINIDTLGGRHILTAVWYSYHEGEQIWLYEICSPSW